MDTAERNRAVKVLLEKGKPDEVRQVRFHTMSEGLCVQMLHTGPYERESESLARMHSFMAEEGFRPRGLHHEIYLSNPRRVAPEKLRTLLRLPVRHGGARLAPELQPPRKAAMAAQNPRQRWSGRPCKRR